MDDYFLECIGKRYGSEKVDYMVKEGLVNTKEYISRLKSKGKDYISTPFDWYAVSIQYPNIFLGKTYGYFKIVFNNTNIRELLLKKVINSKDRSISKVISYFDDRKIPLICMIGEAFKYDLDSYINFTMVIKSVSTALKKMKGSMKIDEYAKTISIYKDYYGLGVDVFSDDVNLLSVKDIALKYNMKEIDVRKVLAYFGRYRTAIATMSVGMSEWGDYISLSSLYKRSRGDLGRLTDTGDKFYFMLGELREYYNMNNKFPPRTYESTVTEWLIRLYDDYCNKFLTKVELKEIDKVFPNLFKLYEEEVIRGRVKTTTVVPQVDRENPEGCELWGILKGKLSDDKIRKLIKDTKCYTKEEYIAMLMERKRASSTLKIVDWYILSNVYKGSYDGKWYGYYKLATGNKYMKQELAYESLAEILANKLVRKTRMNEDELLYENICKSLLEMIGCNLSFRDINVLPVWVDSNIRVGIDYERLRKEGIAYLPLYYKRMKDTYNVTEDSVRDSIKIECGIDGDIYKLKDFNTGNMMIKRCCMVTETSRKVYLNCTDNDGCDLLCNSLIFKDNTEKSYYVENFREIPFACKDENSFTDISQ